MALVQRYRHLVTGLIGEFEKELADVFKDVLEPVDGDEPVAPVEAPATPEPPAEPQGNSDSEESA